ncbi:hypothetical protein EDD63_102117 [Breznakia blatticola]|uniref:Uncharacterized protein n=1 Tax=Breznakia blatticola TaxID=1754012 RepID=A0A4R8A6L2_9FIRM|nr:hypothetical protein [Breznakia blatticola]TDW26096.1 hypothetical protein EDD63_102117 [Breznakia blatticola]
MEKVIVEEHKENIENKEPVTKIQGLYDRVNISVKALDRIIFGGLALIVFMIIISL